MQHESCRLFLVGGEPKQPAYADEEAYRGVMLADIVQALRDEPTAELERVRASLVLLGARGVTRCVAQDEEGRRAILPFRADKSA